MSYIDRKIDVTQKAPGLVQHLAEGQLHQLQVGKEPREPRGQRIEDLILLGCVRRSHRQPLDIKVGGFSLHGGLRVR